MPKRSNTLDNQVWALRKTVRELEKRVHALEKRTPKKLKRESVYMTEDGPISITEALKSGKLTFGPSTSPQVKV